jgi:hypothetical protein
MITFPSWYLPVAITMITMIIPVALIVEELLNTYDIGWWKYFEVELLKPLGLAIASSTVSWILWFAFA